MRRYSVLAILCLAATPALAQNETAPAGPPPAQIAAVQTASSTFTTCIQTGVMGLTATVTPDAGAASVLAGCSTQRQALEAAAHALFATLPTEQRTMAEQQLNSQLAGAQAQIAAGIQQMRGASTPAATPAATPAH